MGSQIFEEVEKARSVQPTLPELQLPPMYQVLLLNDDYTPMEFVVELLRKFFAMEESRAVQIMLEVHHSGKGMCGVYTREVAETKVFQVNQYAREYQHPLLCTMEPEC